MFCNFNYIYLVAAKVSLSEIAKTNLYKSLIRTKYRITVLKRYVTYMGKDMRLRSVYYEPFVTKCYIRVGEVEKKKKFLAYVITEWSL